VLGNTYAELPIREFPILIAICKVQTLLMCCRGLYLVYVQRGSLPCSQKDLHRSWLDFLPFTFSA
jgi:hypothetical protein